MIQKPQVTKKYILMKNYSAHCVIALLCLIHTSFTMLAQQQVITLKTELPIGTIVGSEDFSLNEDSGGKSYTLKGLEALKNGKHKVLSADIRIEGEVYELNCASMKLNKLDITKAPQLKSIDCRDNRLTTIDVSRNVNATYLACGQNPLKQIDISALSQLRLFNCQSTLINTLDLSNTPSLRSLYAHNCTKLQHITFPKDSQLEVAHLFKNNLSELDFSSCDKLETLRCEENKLERLNVEHCTKLIDLDCSYNKLPSLKLSPKAQATVKLFANKISEEEMNVFTQSLSTCNKGIPKPLSIYVIDTSIGDREGNVCSVYAVMTATNKGYKVMNFNGLDAKDYEGTPSSASSNIIKFKSNAQELTLSFAPSEFEKVSISGATLKSKTVSEVDVTVVYSITPQAEVVLMGEITYLECQKNQLTELNIANHKTLAYLLCNDNLLTTFKPTQCEALEELDIHNNHLTSVDFSGCKELSMIDCSSNQIKGQEMDNLISTLYDRHTLENKGSLYVFDAINPKEENVCTVTQVTKATGRGWAAYQQYKEGLWSLYPGSTSNHVEFPSTTSSVAETVAIFDAMGRIRTHITPGYNIIVLRDGTAKKVYTSESKKLND